MSLTTLSLMGIAIVSLIVLACAVFLLALIWTAPDGYEDEDGWHEGEPPIPPEIAAQIAIGAAAIPRHSASADLEPSHPASIAGEGR